MGGLVRLITNHLRDLLDSTVKASMTWCRGVLHTYW